LAGPEFEANAKAHGLLASICCLFDEGFEMPDLQEQGGGSTSSRAAPDLITKLLESQRLVSRGNAG
jgi:hypothetical protein